MNETILFGLLILSLWLPALLGYIVWHIGMPAWLKALVVTIGVMSIVIIQYIWVKTNGTAVIAWWIIYVGVIMLGSLVISD